jgi:hypothetical protein
MTQHSFPYLNGGLVQHKEQSYPQAHGKVKAIRLLSCLRANSFRKRLAMHKLNSGKGNELILPIFMIFKHCKSYELDTEIVKFFFRATEFGKYMQPKFLCIEFYKGNSKPLKAFEYSIYRGTCI